MSNSSETPDSLIKRIGKGICGWLTYQQASGNSTLYNEHNLYEPIFQIVNGPAWEVWAQYKLETAKLRGAPPTIDYLFKKNKSGKKRQLESVFLEVKFIKYGQQAKEDISKDIVKISSVLSDPPEQLNEFQLFGYLLIVGYKNKTNNMVTTNKSLRDPFKNQLHKVKKELTSSSEDGWSIDIDSESNRPFSFLILKKQDWWELKN